MEQYFKPSVSNVSYVNLGAKLQGSGVGLFCSGRGCDGGEDLGARCMVANPDNYVDIVVFEKNVACPTGKFSPLCEVVSLSVNEVSVSDPGSVCYVAAYSGVDCSDGCAMEIICMTSTTAICTSWGDTVHATIACSGFSEPVSCDNPF